MMASLFGKLIPPAAAATSIGSCKFVAVSWGLTVPGLALAAVGVLVFVLCAAGEAKNKRTPTTPQKQETERAQ